MERFAVGGGGEFVDEGQGRDVAGLDEDEGNAAEAVGVTEYAGEVGDAFGGLAADLARAVVQGGVFGEVAGAVDRVFEEVEEGR